MASCVGRGAGRGRARAKKSKYVNNTGHTTEISDVYAQDSRLNLLKVWVPVLL